MIEHKNKILQLILHDVRSAYNVGAIFRTGEGLGVDRIYLTGYTPTPWRKSKPYETAAERMIEKTALGAEKYISWEKFDDIFELINKLKKKNFFIAALEQDKKSVELDGAEINFPCALIVGNETEGVNKNILGMCDAILDIAMHGKKESLNVAVASGIAIYALMQKNEK